MGEHFVNTCRRTLDAHHRMEGREQIQCQTILGMLTGLTEADADAVGNTPRTVKADAQCHGSVPAVMAQAVSSEVQRYGRALEIAARGERQARVRKIENA